MSADCHPTSGLPAVSWSTLSALVSSGRTAGWSWSWTSAPAIVLAQDPSTVTCSLSHAGPPRWCTTRCPVSSSWSSSVCTAMCGSCGTSVATSRAVPRGSPQGPWLPRPHLHYHSLGLELRLFRRPGALVIRGHQPYRRRRVGPWAQSLGRHDIRVRFLVLTVREYVSEDVQEGRQWVVCGPLRGGGQTALTAVAPDVKVQAARGHPWASVGVLRSPRGVDEPQVGVPRAGAVEKVDQSVAPPRVVGGLLFAAAVVEVLISALVEAFPHR